MVFKVAFDFAADAATKSIEAEKRRIARGIGDATDYMGAYTRARLREATGRFWSNPIDFTVNAFAFVRQDAPLVLGGPAGWAVLVYVLPQQAKYLGIEIFGGTRVAGDYATTKKGGLLPTRRELTNSHGNLARNFVREATSLGATWIHLKPNLPAVLARRTGVRGKLDVLAYVNKQQRYKPTFPFFDIVSKSVEDIAAKAFDKYI